MIVWHADKMHNSASNKLLKLIEEPPVDTILLLLAENEELLISTITSRCQTLTFSALTETIIAEQLIKDGVTPTKAQQLANEANGNYNKARDLAQNSSEDLVFEQWFVTWVRAAFKAKGNKSAIHQLLSWSTEVSKQNRETQKNFLHYCLSIIRQALLLNYNSPDLVYATMHVENFELAKFAPFIHENNIQAISEEISKALYHVERNGNARIIFTDLSIKLTRLLHTKSN